MAIQGDSRISALKFPQLLWLRYIFATDSMSLSSLRFLIIFIHHNMVAKTMNTQMVHGLRKLHV